MRPHYYAQLLFLALSLAVAARHGASLPTPAVTHAPHGEEPHADLSQVKHEWFLRNKGFCNVVEIETMLLRDPPPRDRDGTGYKAACQALAGKIADADATIASMKRGQRSYGAYIVFLVGHPVADAGDDRSAGPIMRLVLKYWPENYQALYHAGISEFQLGEFAEAKAHLDRFVKIYHDETIFLQNARKTLAQLKEKGF